MSDALTKTELGLEVPVRAGEEYREHTAERWRERDADSYQFALYCVRELGITNKSELERLVTEHREARGLEGISRNSVIALMNGPEFRPGEIDEIIKRRSQLLTADALDRVEKLLDLAKTSKDLGAASMALTAVYNVKQLSNGAATRITGKPEGGGKRFDHYLEQARRKLEQSQGLVIDVKATAVPVESEIRIQNDQRQATASE